MNTFQEKLDAKRERLENAADRADANADAAYKRADLSEEVSGIPLGQPILVGHHSEARHRAAIKRSHNAMHKVVSETKRAEELRERAATVGTGAINSQDPEAITKLEEKLASLETAQGRMKTTNTVVRTLIKKGVTHETTGEEWTKAHTFFCEELDFLFSENMVREFITPENNGRVVAFAPFQLSNNAAKIKATKGRIRHLTALRTKAPVKRDIEGICTYFENPDMARVQLIFEGKPSSEARSVLKKNGFRWAPSQNAWQRHLNNRGRYCADQVIAALKDMAED